MRGVGGIAGRDERAAQYVSRRDRQRDRDAASRRHRVESGATSGVWTSWSARITSSGHVAAGAPRGDVARAALVDDEHARRADPRATRTARSRAVSPAIRTRDERIVGEHDRIELGMATA